MRAEEDTLDVILTQTETATAPTKPVDVELVDRTGSTLDIAWNEPGMFVFAHGILLF